MMKLYVLVLLSQHCFALKIQAQSSAAAAASSFYAEHPKCIDQTTETTKPIMEAIQEFFPPRHIEPHPAALTALSAMRFGGLAMEFPKEAVFDHDFDMLLVDQQDKKGSDWTIPGMRAMITEFSQHMLKTKGIASKACYGAPDVIALKENETSNGAWNFFVFVDKKTELSGHSPFQNIVNAHLPAFLAAPVNAVANAYHSNFDKVETACDFTSDTVYKWPSSFTQLDFWVDFEHKVFPQVHNAPVLDNKPFLIAGVPFKNFFTHEMIADQVNSVICSDTAKDWFDAKCQFGRKAPDICNFALLGPVVFDSNALAVSTQANADSLLKECSKGLDEKGFSSFQFCHEKSA